MHQARARLNFARTRQGLGGRGRDDGLTDKEEGGRRKEEQASGRVAEWPDDDFSARNCFLH
jgi:hypothetical protein